MNKVFLNCLLIAALVLTAAAITSCGGKASGGVTLTETAAPELTLPETTAPEVKLLKSMVMEEEDGVLSNMVQFEYDAQNRIVKTYHYRYKLSFTRTITYGGNNVTVSVEHFDEHIDADEADYEINFYINGNTITVFQSVSDPDGEQISHTMTVNNEGFITSSEKTCREDGVWIWTEDSEYQYQNGNVTGLQGEFNTSLRPNPWRNEYKYDDMKSPFYNDKTPKWLLQYFFKYAGLNNNITERNYFVYHNREAAEKHSYVYDSGGFPAIRRSNIRSWDGETFIEERKEKWLYTYFNDTAKTPEPGIASAFDIYGTWVYVASEFSPNYWKEVPPLIAIDSDNTLSAWFYQTRLTCVFSGIDAYKFRCRVLSAWEEGIEHDAEEFDEEDAEFFLIYDPAANLLMFTAENAVDEYPFRKRTNDDLNLVHTVESNNEKIPVSVFYSEISDNEYRVNSLEFMYDGKKQTLPLAFLGLDVYGLERILISADEDYNFDGYMDIGISPGHGSYNTSYEIFLYDPRMKKFNYHKELSEVPNIWADNKTKTLKSHAKGGHGGLIYYFSEYTWENGQLVLICSENQDYDDTSEKYIRTTRTLQNGVWTEETEAFKEDEL